MQCDDDDEDEDKYWKYANVCVLCWWHILSIDRLIYSQTIH